MRSEVVILWQEGEWRCEWHPGYGGSARLEVYRGDVLATAEATQAGEGARLRAAILRRRVLEGHLTVES